ncbi:MAG: DEAD/DEAH box helicase [Actinobacteria bacterium]|nr:DEAD/DEAH box helicase [Actinomycetota bacterium]
MSTTFGALGVSDDLVRVLSDAGITQPFPIQTLTIPDGMAGRDVCGKANTGSGKTLAFGLPAIERIRPAEPKHPTGLILVPTRELAKQVFEALEPLAEARRVRMACVYGGMPLDRQVNKLKKGVEIIVATPGRMIDLVQQKAAFLDHVHLVVVDEADRMNDMGFRPQVDWLLRRCTAKRQTMLFSATLDGQVASLINTFLSDPIRHSVDEEVTVELMEHRFLAVHELDKAKLTAALADNHGRTLVFVRTKRNADRLARRLRDEGVSVAAIHGDRTQPQREKALKAFADDKVTALVATDVAARGIHVEGINLVVHYDPPEDEKAYLHRSGRTARAGERGLAVTLALYNQHTIVKALQRRLGLQQPIVEMLSNDARLRDLLAWDPTAEEDAA